MRKSAVLFLVVLFCTSLVVAQQKAPLLSPRKSAEHTFATGKKVTIDYGAPSIRGRKVMGGLVPYGKIWRTGANEATGFVTDTDLMVGGTRVPAGKYTIYTLPGENNWQLIINKQTGQWGTEYSQAQDLARIPMKVESLDSPVEQMTFSFEKTGPDSANLVLEWEKTELSVPLKEAK
ncbi:MAG: DUF2911 domain-containing protein [Terriglobia bacterium]|jgi:hypothetical protein|nr:DUF2911 domain-containing protein [Terriglobia bacterium]